MYSPSVTLRNLFILFNIILIISSEKFPSEERDTSLQKFPPRSADKTADSEKGDMRKPFDESGNLERKTMFAVNIQAAYAIKRIDLILPESKAQQSHIQNLKGLVKSFFTTQDYLYFAEGIHDCRKPLLMQKNSNKILGLTPFSMTSGHSLAELEYTGYRIKFSPKNIDMSPLLQGFIREKVLIEDANDLLVALTFLANQTTDKFWLELNQNVLDNEKTAKIVRSLQGVLTFHLAASKNNPINTNTFFVQHMLYNKIFLDDVYVFVEVVKYLRQCGLDTSILFGSSAMLHEYFVKEDLAETEKLHGRRVAMDKLLAKYRFSYPNLVQTLANMPTPTVPSAARRGGRQLWGDVSKRKHKALDVAASKVNVAAPEANAVVPAVNRVAPQVNAVVPKVHVESDTCESCYKAGNEAALRNQAASDSIVRNRKKKWDIIVVATLIAINWNVFIFAH